MNVNDINKKFDEFEKKVEEISRIREEYRNLCNVIKKVSDDDKPTINQFLSRSKKLNKLLRDNNISINLKIFYNKLATSKLRNPSISKTMLKMEKQFKALWKTVQSAKVKATAFNGLKELLMEKYEAFCKNLISLKKKSLYKTTDV